MKWWLWQGSEDSILLCIDLRWACGVSSEGDAVGHLNFQTLENIFDENCVTWKTKLKPTVQEAMGRRATRVLLACELLMALFANAPSDYIPQGRNNSHYRHPQNAWLKVWFSWNPSQQTQNPFNHLFSFINKSAKIRIITSTATTMSSLIWQAWANLWSCTRVWVGTLLPILKGWF